jgi:hypothetical protein
MELTSSPTSQASGTQSPRAQVCSFDMVGWLRTRVRSTEYSAPQLRVGIAYPPDWTSQSLASCWRNRALCENQFSFQLCVLVDDFVRVAQVSAPLSQG